MSAFRVAEVGAFEGRRKLIARELGARAIRLNQFDSEPGQEGHEHDERESGQEEIYIPLRGSGVLRVDGEEVELRPGLYVLVPPESTRVVVAGDDGLSYAVVGAVVPAS
jgi:quercetin dioxygenase-like cupin family protein